MGYSQTKKQSLTEKKLIALRQQLYGKEESVKSTEYLDVSIQSTDYHLPATISSRPTTIINLPDTQNYLGSDLKKILIFATLAVSFQLTIFLVLNHKLI